MVTTQFIENSIPDFVSDQKLIKLVKIAYKHLPFQEQQKLLSLAGLSSLDLNARILCRLIRITYSDSSFEHKIMFSALLEKGIDACIIQNANFLNYEQLKQTA